MERQPIQGKVVTDAKIKSGFQFIGNKIESVPLIECVLTIEGQKREKTINLVYSHCPFCGVKYKEEKEVNNG